MRYLKPAAFLLLLVGSSVPFLSRTAIAADDGFSVPEGATNNDSEVSQAGAASEALAVATSQSKLVALLDSAQGEANRSLISSVSFSATPKPALLSTLAQPTVLEIETLQAPQFTSLTTAQAIPVEVENPNAESVITEVKSVSPDSKALEDMEDFRQLVQNAQAPASDSSGETSDSETPDDELPTLEEVAPPADTVPDAPSLEPAEDPAVNTDNSDEAPDASDSDASDSDASDSAGTETEAVEPIESPLVTPDSLTSPAADAAELDAVPDILISDPNPLSVPVLSEEVEIEQNPLVTLDEAIELAYRNNQTLQASILQLEQAEAALAQQKAARLPTVSTAADIQDSQQGSVDQIQLGASVSVNYDLFTGGGRRASIRAAELQQEVSALAVEAQQEQLRLVTANLYYALQESIEQIRINQSFVDEADRNLSDSELRQSVGVGTRFDVLRAEVQLANAQQALVQSQFNENIARRDIARLLNLPPTAGLQTTPVARAEDWPLDLEESILLAFQNRSELEQQLLQADISEQQRQIALSAIRPQVSLTASYGLETILDSSIPTVDTGEFTDTSLLSLNLNWTLFNGGASRASARQQEIAALIAEEQFSENLDQIRFDVEQAFFNLQANETNITTSNSAVVQAEAALELANLRLQAGVGTQLDVLSAQSELTQAQVNNVTAILGYNRALVSIQRAISNVEL
ncbi:MAG: TolC family protein [Phormidesmis sp.]